MTPGRLTRSPYGRDHGALHVRLLFTSSDLRHGSVSKLALLTASLLWASPVLPGSTRDLTAARRHGIIEALADAGLKCWDDKACQGADGLVRVPFRGRRPKRRKRRHNTTHAKIRCVGE
ncbi:transposase family protein [Streptomyces pulveraceus]|uniref:Transposase family protein n=1 Tax=Streptomyces pulveraceus TaxID=68258 RepID=A0ABW1GI08_9ACTN